MTVSRIMELTERVELTREEHRWVRGKWAKIRESQRAADAAGNKWCRVSKELDDYLDDKYITDIVQRVKIKKESLALQDAFDGGKWHAAEAQRHIDDLQMFLQLKTWGLL